MSPVYDMARDLSSIGISVLPIRADGSKAPVVEWAEYRRRRPRPTEVCSWFSRGPCGLAVIGGRVSGNLEVLDHDDAGAYDAWHRVVSHEAPGLLERIPRVLTPDGGHHLYYRHQGEPMRNTKLAADEAGHTLIETRGEGGYAIVPPSPPACHPSHRPYQPEHLSLLDVPELDEEERLALLEPARALNRYQRHEEERVHGPAAPGDGTRPGDDFNRRAAWGDILCPHGWTFVRHVGETDRWCRPGKRHAVSATTGYGGTIYLYMFTSSAAPFDQNRSYSPFAAYTYLEHGGDFSAAARDLAAHGYGEQRDKGPVQEILTGYRGRHGLAAVIDAYLRDRGLGCLYRSAHEGFLYGPCPFHHTEGKLWVREDRNRWGCHCGRIKSDLGGFLAMTDEQGRVL